MKITAIASGTALLLTAGFAQGMAAPSHAAVGVVKQIDVAAGKVTIDHEPIKTLYWPAMTMEFAVHDKALLGKLSAGRKVNFEISKHGTEYDISAVK